MHATTVAIDLAKDVFELAFADGAGRILERKRLSRRAFARVLENRPALSVVMEACGSAHYWARRFQAQGHAVLLLPPRDVKPYVRRNKTDRADAAGLVEAARCGQIDAVPVKSPRQQGLQALHRVRQQLKAQRTATINLVRGLLREYGVAIPNGAAKVAPAVRAALDDVPAANSIPCRPGRSTCNNAKATTRPLSQWRTSSPGGPGRSSTTARHSIHGTSAASPERRFTARSARRSES